MHTGPLALGACRYLPGTGERRCRGRAGGCSPGRNRAGL